MSAMLNGNISVAYNESTTSDYGTTCSYFPHPLDSTLKEYAVLHIINCILNGLFAVSATIGNLLVLTAIWKTPTLRNSPSCILLSSLALSDLAVGLIVQPLYITFKAAHMTMASINLLCVLGTIFECLTRFLLGVSLYTVAAVNLDLYLAIHLHLRYHEEVTPARVTAVLVFIWTGCAFFATMYFWQKTVLRLVVILFIVVPLVIVFFVYLKIYCVVRRHQRRIQAQAKAQAKYQGGDDISDKMPSYKSSVFNVICVFCCLLLCYSPLFCVFILRYLMKDHLEGLQRAQNCAMTIMLSNSTINPLVYCWRIREIRIAVLRVIAQYLPSISRWLVRRGDGTERGVSRKEDQETV